MKFQLLRDGLRKCKERYTPTRDEEIPEYTGQDVLEELRRRGLE